MISQAFTAADAVQHALDFLGTKPDGQVVRDVRRSVRSALRELATAHCWGYLTAVGRVNTVGPYNQGTIQYTQATRTAVLTGGVWPAWAAQGTLRVGVTLYPVAQLVDAQTILLDPVLNPQADLPAGTPYNLVQDTYPLPPDFLAMDQAQNPTYLGTLQYVHPRDWLLVVRAADVGGLPAHYTVTGDSPNYPRRMALRLFPYPVEGSTVDFLYLRSPRPVSFPDYSTGLVSATQGSAALVGVNTAWVPAMQGAVLRLSGDSATVPTGAEGSNPAVFESVITAVTSPTTLTVADPADATRTDVMHQVSDPIDVDPGAMLNLFLRALEKHVAIARNVKEKADAIALYEAALREAKAADSRSFAGRAVGLDVPLRQRLARMPITFSGS